MKIVVLAGGFSPERNVSLVSGRMICEALRERGHQALLVDLYLGIDCQVEQLEDLFIKLPGLPENSVSSDAVDFAGLKKQRVGNSQAIFGQNVIELCQKADLTFLGLHGEEGENGKVQATLEALGINYTGSDYFGSALAMDKKISKLLMDQGGVKTPLSTIVTAEDSWVSIAEKLKFPVVIKPSNGGSSIGVTIATNEQEAQNGIAAALNYDSEALLEEYIQGREFSVGFLGERLLPAVEIIPKSGFYDYENKYQIGFTEEICPPDISTELHLQLQAITKQVVGLLKLKNYGRVDFIVDSLENIYCLEANSLPGMTPTSLLPKEASAAGLTFSELCEEIVQLSI